MMTMRHGLLCLMMGAAHALAGQVRVDTPVHLTGADGQRRIDGLAPPTEGSSLVTVRHALLGGGQWAQAEAQADTIALTLVPAVEVPSEGLLLRFLMPSGASTVRYLRLGIGPVLPLRRPDGTPPVVGQLAAGMVCEVMAGQGVFLLMAPALRGCPAGWATVHPNLCIQVQDTPGLNFHQSALHCARSGGRLCTWDEYIRSCTVLQDQLIGLFDGWEWIDDTSNHTHTGDQVANTDCFTQRSVGPLQTHQARCCMHPR